MMVGERAMILDGSSYRGAGIACPLDYPYLAGQSSIRAALDKLPDLQMTPTGEQTPKRPVLCIAVPSGVFCKGTHARTR
jgi:hypothetical protein